MLPTDTATGKNPQLFSFPGGCGVHATVRGLSSRAALVAVVLAAAACGRTQLDAFSAAAGGRRGHPGRPAGRPRQRRERRARDVPPDVPPDAPPDLPPDLPPDVPPTCRRTRRPTWRWTCRRTAGWTRCRSPRRRPRASRSPRPATARTTTATARSTRTSPRSPCPDGGNRYCVGGRYSDCPRRCDVCVPGSKRTCITSYCTFWGSQTCSADGRSFGRCDESRPPPECEEIANKMMRSPALEMCCLDNGYCCVDEFDLDHDGDRTEMLGRCEAVLCDP